METPDHEMERQAKEIATRLVSFPSPDRRMRLREIRKQSPVLDILVRGYLHKLRDEAKERNQ